MRERREIEIRLKNEVLINFFPNNVAFNKLKYSKLRQINTLFETSKKFKMTFKNYMNTFFFKKTFFCHEKFNGNETDYELNLKISGQKNSQSESETSKMRKSLSMQNNHKIVMIDESTQTRWDKRGRSRNKDNR